MSVLTESQRLIGVRAKIERAKEHIVELQTRISAFEAGNPYCVSKEHDSESGDLLFKVRLNSTIPVTFPVIVGDILNNLRAALDHLAWQLVEVGGKTPDPRATSFPIFKGAEEYKAGRDAKVKGMSDAAINLIDATKPYQGGNEVLWLIHDLNRIDKHRLLIQTAACSPSMSISHKRQLLSFPATVPLVFKDSRILMRISAAARASGLVMEMDHDPQFAFLVTFGEPEVLKSKALVPTFEQFADFVNGVVNQFVPLL